LGAAYGDAGDLVQTLEGRRAGGVDLAGVGVAAGLVVGAAAGGPAAGISATAWSILAVSWSIWVVRASCWSSSILAR
jgi:hypothetical protein